MGPRDPSELLTRPSLTLAQHRVAMPPGNTAAGLHTQGYVSSCATAPLGMISKQE